MSRYEVYHKDKALAFGSDRACGEFLMIWQRPIDPKERREQDKFGPNPEEMLVDVDTVFNKDFDKDKMKELVESHGFSIEELERAYLDLFYKNKENIYSSLDELGE